MFWRWPRWWSRYTILRGVDNRNSAQWGWYHVLCTWQGIHKAVTLSPHFCSLCKRPHQKKNKTKIDYVINSQQSTHKVGTSTSQVVLGRVPLSLHAARRPRPYGASRVVHAMSAWLVETRTAPPRHCCRRARVYGLRLRLCSVSQGVHGQLQSHQDKQRKRTPPSKQPGAHPPLPPIPRPPPPNTRTVCTSGTYLTKISPCNPRAES